MKHRAIVLSVLLVVSMMAGVASLGAEPASAAPPGFVTIPDDAVGHDIPDDLNGYLPVNNTELVERSQGATLASNHSDTLNATWVVLNTKSGTVVDESAVNAIVNAEGDPPLELALVLGDAEHHAGREVAVPMDLLEDIDVDPPKAAWGEHEDGTQWVREIEYENGYATFEVPKFSTNTITWSGQFTIEAYPATDGSSYTYEQNDTIESFDIEVTGVETNETETVSGAGLSDGGTIDASIAGNMDPPSTSLTFTGNQYTGGRYTPSGTGDVTGISINGDASPTGPNGGEPEITFTGNGDTTSRTISQTAASNGATKSISVGGNLDTENGVVTFTGRNTDTGRAVYSLGTYTDGGTDSFSITELDEAGNPTINLTGKLSTEWANQSASGVGVDHTQSVSFGANDGLTDGAGGNPTLMVTGHATDKSFSNIDANGDGAYDFGGKFIGDMGGTTTLHSEFAFTPDQNMSANQLIVDIYSAGGSDYGATVEVSIASGGVNQDTGDGTVVQNDWNPDWSTGNQAIQFDSSYDLVKGNTYHVNFVTSGNDGDSTEDKLTLKTDSSASSTKRTFYADSWTTGDDYGDLVFQEKITIDDLNVSDGDGHTHSFGSFADGETKSTTLDLQTSAKELNFTGVGDGTIDYTLTVQERTITENPGVTLNGNSYSYTGTLVDGEKTSLSISESSLREGTNDVSVSLPSLSADSPAMEVGIDGVEYDDIRYSEDPALDLDGDGTNEVSYAGKLSSGQTHSETVNLAPGSYTAGSSLVDGEMDWEWSFDEITATEDPAVDVDGDGSADASHTGVLRSGETATYQLSALQTGTTTVDTEVLSGPQPDWELIYDEELFTDSPGLDIDGDGTDEASYTGKLAAGETAEYTIDPSLGDDSWTVNTTGPVDVSAQVEERTLTEDVTISINGNTTTYTGILDAGNTTALAADPAWINESGDNQVDVEVAPSLTADAPTPSVDLYYTHDGVDKDLVVFEGEKWSERYNISKTYAENQSEANVTIPFDGAVLSVRTFEYSVNGGTWESVPDTDYQFDNTTLTAQFGAVSAGDEIDVRAVGSKVNVYDGEIQVADPTMEGEKLDTEFEIVEKGPDFGIEVTNALEEERVWYVETASWQDPDPYALVDSTGEQTLKTPNANNGSTGRVKDLPLWVEPENDVEVQILDADVPRFKLRPGQYDNDLVEIRWDDTVSGQTYELRDISNDRPVDTDTAESPVWFTASDSALTYEILETTLTGADSPTAGPVQESETYSLTLMAAIVLGIGGLLLVVRGLGGLSGGSRTGKKTSRDRSISIRGYELSLPSLPSLPSWDASRSSSARDTQRMVVVGGMVIIGVVALELATPDSLYQTVLAALMIADTQVRELMTILIGIGVLLGLWFLDQRTTESIPRWLTAIAAVVTVVYILETMQPGVILGPASEGFETMSALFWLVLLGGGAYVAYGYVQAKQAPDTQVTLQMESDQK